MSRPISPLLFYRDPKAALDFLERAFGFETRWWSMTARAA